MNYKYYKGDFTGLSNSKDLIITIGKHNFYDFNWSYFQVKNIKAIEAYDVEEEKVGDFYYSKKIVPKKSWMRPYFWKTQKPELIFKKGSFGIEYINISFPKLKKRPDVFISVNEDNYFNDNLHDVIIRDFKLEDSPNTYIKKEFIDLKGIIYFKIEIPEVAKSVENVVESNTGMNRSEKVDLTNEANVNTIQTSDNLDSLVTVSDNGTQDQIITTQPNSGNTFPKISAKSLGIVLGTLLWIIILAFFWVFFHKYYIFAVLAFVGWFISRFLSNRNFKAICNVFFAGAFLIFIASIFSNKATFVNPTIPKKDGTIKINPPKPVKREGASADDIDYEVSKDINWFDFINNKYELKYNTSVQSFFNSQKQHNEADIFFRKTSNNSISYFNKLFSKLELLDETKIDSIVRLISKKAELKKLNQLQTAEMVTTLIQEIPYVLVHQNTCQQIINSSPGDSFIVKYHEEHKPCMPNVPGGVQSPYEFLHNLKGDCDTRSLLGFAILKKLNIAASVWVSEAYGHSVLGIGLPIGNGVFKNINGLNHYPVELTAKGFRLGMIAPQHRDMSNWDIALYSNNY